MHGISPVVITRQHFRTKRSRINGVSDAFRPLDDARNGRQGPAVEHIIAVCRQGRVFRRDRVNAGFDA